MTLSLTENTTISIKQTHPYAVVAITKHGVQIARTLLKTFQQVDVYYMKKFEYGDEHKKGIQLFEGSVRFLLPSLFKKYKGIILIISLGAVVRMIAPILKDKKTDPGVVVIDDKGENVISVLSGHLGGANELTREVAKAMSANPIITTASDVQETIPVDLFGKRFGWEWDSPENLTPVSAAVVNEEQIAIIQESGERHWWDYDKPLPKHIKVYKNINEAKQANPDAVLMISHRLLTNEEKEFLANGVLYRPKVIVLGIGCNRGTSSQEIETVIHETLREINVSVKSVKAIATIEIKKDEKGLREVAQKYNWDFVFYHPEQLNRVPIDVPSETVFKFTGAYGVSEPAAKLYSGSNHLLVKKKKSGNVTISVGLIEHT